MTVLLAGSWPALIYNHPSGLYVWVFRWAYDESKGAHEECMSVCVCVFSWHTCYIEPAHGLLAPLNTAHCAASQRGVANPQCSGLAGGYHAALFTLVWMGEECGTDVLCVDLAVGLHAHSARTRTVSVPTCVAILKGNEFFTRYCRYTVHLWGVSISWIVAYQDWL